MTPEERFWSRVNKTDGCWLWTGGKTSRGYGVITIDTKAVYVHRYSLELDGRPLGPGEMACHDCDTPLCVNPDHLFVGDVRSNAADMVFKDRQNKDPKPANQRAKMSASGKQRFAERPWTHWETMKTHCPQGHPYSPENTYVARSGKRKCRECGRARDRRNYWRRKAAA